MLPDRIEKLKAEPPAPPFGEAIPIGLNVGGSGPGAMEPAVSIGAMPMFIPP